MGKFTKISQSTFNELQLETGVLLKKINTENGEFADEDIVCATTGGINATCVPTFSDLGEDVDNCPNGMKELKHLDSWESKMTFTALSISAEMIKRSLGCADIEGSTVKPRRELKQTDYEDIWWVGDMANGGAVAIQLKNALSTGGFSLQTSKNSKGQLAVELTGHVSIDAQDEMPMQFYMIKGATE